MLQRTQRGLVILAFSCASLAAAQAPVATPTFDVTSVKLCDGGKQAPSGNRSAEPPSPDTLTLACYPLRVLVARAYVRAANGVVQGSPPRIPVQGGPSWLDRDRYQISAKTQGAPGFAMMNGPMLQALLEDRFQLKLHRETREVPVYKLVARDGAARLRRSMNGSCVPLDYSLPTPWPQFCGVPKAADDPNEGFDLIGATLPELCNFLAGMQGSALDREVIDGTGIAGQFDIHFPGKATFQAAATDDPSNPRAALLGVIQAALAKAGLTLVAARGPGQIIVIDQVERPRAN